MAKFWASVKVTFTASKKVCISCLEARGSTQGRMFLIKKKKTFHASGKYANRGKKKKVLPETPVMTPWQRKNLSTVGVYNMKAAEGLQNPFQIDTQLLRISAIFFFFFSSSKYLLHLSVQTAWGPALGRLENPIRKGAAASRPLHPQTSCDPIVVTP